MEKHEVMPENVEKFKDWLANRGGIAIWKSVNLSNPGLSMSSPALEKDGTPYSKPSWQVANQPERIITDPADVVVIVPKEVKRFHVGVRMGSQGMSYKVTDGGTRRIRAAVVNAGDGAWYEFDYSTQEAVILVPDMTVPLNEWQPTKEPANV